MPSGSPEAQPPAHGSRCQSEAGGTIGEAADHSDASLDLFVEPLQPIGGPEPGTMRRRKGVTRKALLDVLGDLAVSRPPLVSERTG